MWEKYSDLFLRRRALITVSAAGAFSILADRVRAQSRIRASQIDGIHYATLANATLGINGDLNGDIPFPADNPWNTDIADPKKYPVDTNSPAIIAHIGAGTNLHADFGPPPYGIPYIVVGAGQELVQVRVPEEGGYRAQSDRGPFPIPPDAPVEGGVSAYREGGDSHVIVLSRSAIPGRTDQLFEMWRAKRGTDGSWTADSVAAFDVRSNDVRPAFQGRCDITSADAAGLPIFPGLVRYDEVVSGRILHALRFTAESTRAAYVPPAMHWASTVNKPNFPPMGARLRLKAEYVIPQGFSSETKTILEAMKRFGLILADNGGNWYISGTSDPRWAKTRVVEELRQVKGRHFEVLSMNGLRSTCR